MFPMQWAGGGLVLVWAVFCCLCVDHSAAGPIDVVPNFPTVDVTLPDQSDFNNTVEISPHVNGTNCECGLAKNYVPRIVGGDRSSIMQYPWMAGLSAFGFIFCGGAIISDRYIMSVAHCFKEDVTRSLTVASLGITYRDEQVIYEVEKVILHELYKKTVKGRYDIALIKLKNPLKFTNKIRPVCLPLPTTNFTDFYGIVAGWGVVEHGGEVSNELRSVPMRIMSNQACHKLYNYADENSLCAGGVEGKDACQGDSGSPLFVDVDGVHRLAGVVSWGIGCAKKGFPGVFTNIQYYLSWIIEHTKDAECQQESMNPGWTSEFTAKMSLMANSTTVSVELTPDTTATNSTASLQSNAPEIVSVQSVPLPTNAPTDSTSTEKVAPPIKNDIAI